MALAREKIVVVLAWLQQQQPPPREEEEELVSWSCRAGLLPGLPPRHGGWL